MCNTFTFILYLTATLAGLQAPSPDCSEVTVHDIPAGLSSQLKTLIEQTFSADTMQRHKALDQLGDMGKEAAPAIPFLIRLLDDQAKNDRWIPVYIVASIALVRIGEPAVTPLINAFRRSSGHKKSKILLTLESFANPRVLDAIVESLSDPDEEVRSTAHNGIGVYLRSYPEVAKVPGLPQRLVRALSSRYSEVRSVAIDGLTLLRYRDAFEQILSMLSDQDTNVRSRAIEYLGAIGGPRAKAALFTIARDKNKDIYDRETAAESLGDIPDSDVVDYLLAAVRDHSDEKRFRRHAARGLGRTKSPRVLEPLQTLVADPAEDIEVRMAALRSVVKLQGLASGPKLLATVNNKAEQWRLRQEAAFLLVDIKNGAIDDPLVLEVIIKSGADECENALLKISQNGMSEEIRTSAKNAHKAIRGY